MSLIMKRHIIAMLVLVVFAFGLTGCDLIAAQLPTDSTAEAGGEVIPTPDSGKPDGVAQSFLNSWMEGDYAAMYGYLSSNSQADYTLEEFTSIYTTTAETMQLIDLEASPQSVLLGPNGDTAQLAFRVVYNTLVLGPIVEELTMPLVYDGVKWGIVWRPSLIFEELAGGNTLQLEVETPSRANIYDRNGEWLVSANASTVTITAIPGKVGEAYEDQMLDLLSSVLRMSPTEIKQQYSGQPDDWVVALGDADAETVQANWDALSSYSALGFIEKSGRRYYNVLAPHLLGYTGYIQESQLDYYRSLGYTGDEIVGQSGLELWGEQYLVGSRGGVLSAWTAGGQYFGEVARKDPQPAQSLYLTIDREFQADVEQALEDAYRVGVDTWVPNAGGAAIVVLDVNNGNVLAMASYPGFDPNVLHPYNSHPLYTDTYISDMLNNPLKPLFNRATQGQYPPGSIFKVVSMTTALESGIFTADSIYHCTGVWNETGDMVRYDWREGGHGTLTLTQGLTASCNPWFYHIGMYTGQQSYDLLPYYAREYFLGQELGLEIAEEPGLVPDQEWLWEERGEEWNLSDSINMAIGQGDLLVSPMQIAVTIAAIANGGTVYQPQFVDQIGLIAEEPTIVMEPVILNQADVSPETLAAVREGMRGVVSNPMLGTAEYRLGTMEIPVAGKTGTAQVSGEGRPIAWFGGFAPYDDPEIAVVVMIENGGQGSGVAAPIFRRVIEKYYGLTVLSYPSDWGNPEEFDFGDEVFTGE